LGPTHCTLHLLLLARTVAARPSHALPDSSHASNPSSCSGKTWWECRRRRGWRRRSFLCSYTYVVRLVLLGSKPKPPSESCCCCLNVCGAVTNPKFRLQSTSQCHYMPEYDLHLELWERRRRPNDYHDNQCSCHARRRGERRYHTTRIPRSRQRHIIRVAGNFVGSGGCPRGTIRGSCVQYRTTVDASDQCPITPFLHYSGRHKLPANLCIHDASISTQSHPDYIVFYVFALRRCQSYP